MSRPSLTGSPAVRNLNTDLVKRVRVIVPPLAEQRSIVAILERAFGDLAQVTANLYLQEVAVEDLFSRRVSEILAGSDGWEARKLGDVCVLRRGFDLPVQDRKPGSAPLISSSGPIGLQSEAPIQAPGVVTGRSGSIGKVFWVEDDFWPLNTTLFVKDFHGNDPRFIFRLLQNFDLARFAGGTGVPTLNRNSVHSEAVVIPISVDAQRAVAARIDALEDERQRLQGLVRNRLDLVGELKQSLLARAFSGELTREPLAA